MKITYFPCWRHLPPWNIRWSFKYKFIQIWAIEIKWGYDNNIILPKNPPRTRVTILMPVEAMERFKTKYQNNPDKFKLFCASQGIKVDDVIFPEKGLDSQQQV